MCHNSVVQLEASTAVLVDSPMFTGGQFSLRLQVYTVSYMYRGK